MKENNQIEQFRKRFNREDNPLLYDAFEEFLNPDGDESDEPEQLVANPTEQDFINEIGKLLRKHLKNGSNTNKIYYQIMALIEQQQQKQIYKELREKLPRRRKRN